MNDPSPLVQVAICASTKTLTCALRVDGGAAQPLLGEGTELARGANLTALLAAAFTARGLSPQSLSDVLLDIGPGSYTGLRVAVTFARIVARFADVRVRVATSFELIAAALCDGSAPEGFPRGDVRIVLDARRGRVHSGAIDIGGDESRGIRLREAPCALVIAEFVASLAPGQTVVADESLSGWLEPAAASAGAIHRTLPSYGAMQLFSPRLELRAADLATLEPLYLMGSYAE